MKFCDLHTHSYYSDGSESPRTIARMAAERGLAVALTDHNTTAGLCEFMSEAKTLGVPAVAGVELSTLYGQKELHLLGLFLPAEHYATIEAFTDRYKELKRRSNAELVSRLTAAGYLIDLAEIEKNAKGNVNRAHIAAELARCGYVDSIPQAFDTLLSEEQGFYLPPDRPSLIDAIAMLKSIGALPVLAHPLKELSEDELRRLLPQAIDAGLLGIETLHSSYSDAQSRCADGIASDFRILKSGGSDFHGSNKQGVELGVGCGNLSVPIEIYESLSARAKQNFT